MQLMGNNDKGDVTMETVLGHSSGEYTTSLCVIPIANLQGGGGKNPAQIMGASITYMRRYQYAAIIGLAQDDTDAAALTETDKQWVNILKSDLKRAGEITDAKYLKFILGNL